MSAADGSFDTLRRALRARRAETASRLAELQRLEQRIVEASADSNADDEHDPEGATIAWDRAQTAALAEQARAALDDLDRALIRIEAGWDGSCARCGAPIGAGRLEARPATDRCIDCAGRPR